MESMTAHGPALDLSDRGGRQVYRNLPPARLYEEAIHREEAVIVNGGPLLALTGSHTGRSPNDRFIVRRGEAADQVGWGAVNRPIEPEHFERLREKVRARGAEVDLFVFEGYAGAAPESRIKVRIITERAWHSLFARNMFIRELDPAQLVDFEPDFTVVDLPSVKAEPETDGTNSGTFIVLDLEQNVALLGGTEYAGEIKKSVFSLMNYRLPRAGVLSMHCSASYGEDRNRSALFFGLSGTGKTTLSADPGRTLIGDDEHGWGAQGVFNIEGGCYAKVIRLDPEGEPQIYSTTRRFGTVLENVVCDSRTRTLDLDDNRLTENTRSSYPLSHLERVDLSGVAGHPETVVFLTCDAFGVLPPISRLSDEQAMYHFLSGYTAKVAGTERGVTEPQATFSACFGAPFMPLDPSRYARMLGERLREHQTSVWLVNTGWTGGPYGVGHRMPLAATRRMVSAVLSGELEDAEMRVDEVFRLHTPKSIEGVDAAELDPRSSWSDRAAYDAKLRELAVMFVENFRNFEASAADEIRAVAPEV